MQLMIILDGNVVALALPAIQSDLGFSASGLAWVANAYLIPFGLLLLPFGRLGDMLGSRRVFMAGLAVFTAASLACGLATSAEMLLAARAVQGAGGAAAAAVILGMIVTAYPRPGEQAWALGLFSFVSAAGAAIGLIGGGVIASAFGWHWIFLVNVPIGLGAFLLAPFVVPASPRVRGLRRPRVAVGPAHLTAALVFAAGFGFQFMTALYMQNVLGYSAAEAGLAFLPTPIVIGAVSLLLAPVLTSRYGARRVLLVGLGSFVAGLLLLSRAPVAGSFVVDLLPVFVLAGIGVGLAIPAVNMLAMADAAPSDTGFASGLVNTVQQAGAVVSLAVLTSVAAARTRSAVDATPEAALRDGYMLGALLAAGFVAVALIITASTGRRRASAVPAEVPPTEGGRRIVGGSPVDAAGRVHCDVT